MKKILCILLVAACVLALGSCEILEKFLSFERVETNAPTHPYPTAPDAEGSQKPNEDKDDANTPNQNEEQTTHVCEDCTTVDPNQNDPQEPQAQKITVEVKFQSGGVHACQENVTVDAPATFSQVYNLFVTMHEEIKGYRLNCYINDKKIDPTQTIFLNNGDRIYLEESGASLDEEYPCIHVWSEGVCTQCGNACMHESFGDDRACLICGAQLGVNLLQIEIYENGEFKHYAGGSIETTVQDLLNAFYGYYPWEYWTSSYEFYYNNVIITDGSYMITEHGILNLVTRSY